MPLKYNESPDYLYSADYCSPKIAWEQINDYIPKERIIWEPFYCDGMSGEFLKELGCNVIHKNEDFFKVEYHDSVIVSNPPFDNLRKILTRIKQLGNPFILIMPVGTICSQYFAELFGDDIQILIPSKRIQFLKNGDQLKRCYFNTMYYCYKMNLAKDIIRI